MKIPSSYVPESLSPSDKQKQMTAIIDSRKEYDEGKYTTRKKLKSFVHKRSKHMKNAEKKYNKEFSSLLKKIPKCSPNLQKRILRKGRGAYYSSGSRPNQTATSWALARLASAITGGPASEIDEVILKEECSRNSLPLKMLLERKSQSKKRNTKSRKQNRRN